MSQFILFTSFNLNLNDFDTNVEEVNDEHYLMSISRQLFMGDLSSKKYTVTNFDALCTSAQEEFLLTDSILSSNLVRVIDRLISNNEKIFLWYGDDYSDLYIAKDRDEVLNIIQNGLLQSSGEIYLSYGLHLGLNK